MSDGLDPRAVTLWPTRRPSKAVRERVRRIENYWKNPQAERERARRYYWERYREKVAQARREKYQRNPEAERQRSREWGARNAQRKRDAARARYRADPQRFIHAAMQREAALKLLRAALDWLDPPARARACLPAGCPRARLTAKGGVVTATPSWKVAKKGPPEPR